jgi:hypothetical protein
VTSVACGDDSDTDSMGNPSSGSDASSSSEPDASAAAPRSDAGGGSCLSTVYSPLSDGCKSCACTADPVVAPTCGKPCWDFIACSFAAQAGKCAPFAAGGAAMRPQFEACTMEECGAFLAVPGAEVVSSYRTVTLACAVPMGSTPGACAEDIGKIAAGQKK